IIFNYILRAKRFSVLYFKVFLMALPTFLRFRFFSGKHRPLFFDIVTFDESKVITFLQSQIYIILVWIYCLSAIIREDKLMVQPNFRAIIAGKVQLQFSCM